MQEFKSCLESNTLQGLQKAYMLLEKSPAKDKKEMLQNWWSKADASVILPALAWDRNPINRGKTLDIGFNSWILYFHLQGNDYAQLAGASVMNIKPILHKWAVTAAKHVFPIWAEWAEANAPEVYTASCRVLELAELGQFDQNESTKLYRLYSSKWSQDRPSHTMDFSQESTLASLIVAPHAYLEQAAKHSSHASWAANNNGKTDVKHLDYYYWRDQFETDVFNTLKQINSQG